MAQWVKDNDFLNKVLFVPPPPSYEKSDFPDQLVWLGNEGDRFPCLLLFPPSKRTYYVILYFHGNGCDLGGIGRLLWSIMRKLQVGIVAPEYPGYGLSEGATPCESSVKQCARLTLEFVVNKLKIPLERIVIFGTSIGTGAACWLASKVLEKKRKLGALVLQSPFLSIKAIIKQVSIFESKVANIFAQVGSNFIADRFMNLQAMKGVQYPLLVLHGVDDELIPVSHGKILFDSSSADIKQLVLFPHVGHNDFDWNLVIKKLAAFLEKIARFYRHERKIDIHATAPSVVALRHGPTGDIERAPTSRFSTMIGSTFGTLVGSAIGVAQSLSSEIKEDPAQSLESQHGVVRYEQIPQGRRNSVPVGRNNVSPSVRHTSQLSRRASQPQRSIPQEFRRTYSPRSCPTPVPQVPSIHRTKPPAPNRRIPLKQPKDPIQIERQNRRWSIVSDQSRRTSNSSRSGTRHRYSPAGNHREETNTSSRFSTSSRTNRHEKPGRASGDPNLIIRPPSASRSL